MDTTAAKTEEGDKVEIAIQAIKVNMPELYKSIQIKAALIGRLAYQLVRRGVSGEVNCFYGWENGRVVGTPFNCPQVTSDIALHVVEFGSAHVCIFGDQLQPGYSLENHGKN